MDPSKIWRPTQSFKGLFMVLKLAATLLGIFERKILLNIFGPVSVSDMMFFITSIDCAGSRNHGDFNHNYYEYSASRTFILFRGVSKLLVGLSLGFTFMLSVILPG